MSEKRAVPRSSPFLLSVSDRLSPNLVWLLQGAFVVAVTFLGGSSRPDALQSAMLLPLAALLLIPALSHLRLGDFDQAKPVGLLLFTLVVWIAIQMIPLPPGLWHALPGRETIAEIDRFSTVSDIWRPISMTPFRTWGSLLGLVVPIAAFLLALAFGISPRALLFVIAAIGIVNASLGLLQVIGGANSPLYLYAFASRGAPAGVFANENHSAVFSAITLLIIARLALEARSAGDPIWIRLSFAPALLFILLAVLVTGSRAGFVATLASLLAVISMWVCHSRTTVAQIASTKIIRRHGANRLVIVGFSAAVALVIFAFVWSERTPAAQDIAVQSSFQDLRWSLLPLLWEMMLDHWLVGTGFGSFDVIYRAYEPTALLIPAYVNHAHNDWLQLVIEGGLPAALIFGGLLGWIIKSVARAGRGTPSNHERLIFWVASIAIVATASLVDYPLRTPLFQIAVIWLLLCLSADRHGRNATRQSSQLKPLS